MLVLKPAILLAYSVKKCGNIQLWFTSYPTTSPYIADTFPMNQTVQFQKVYHNTKLTGLCSSNLISSHVDMPDWNVLYEEIINGKMSIQSFMDIGQLVSLSLKCLIQFKLI